MRALQSHQQQHNDTNTLFSHVRRRTCLLRNVCKGPNQNQILFFEDPVISLLPLHHTTAGLHGLGSLNAWTYTDEAAAQGLVPTVVKGDVAAADSQFK